MRRFALISSLLACGACSVSCAFPEYGFPGSSPGDSGDDSFVADVEGDSTLIDAPNDSALDSIPPDALDAFDAFDSGVVADGADAAALPDPTDCGPHSSVSACAPSPSFSGLHLLEGEGDEFCGMATRGYLVNDGEQKIPASASAPERVVVYLATDPNGVHGYVGVFDDPKILVGGTHDLLAGDAVEVFLHGHHDAGVTGALDADQAVHVVIAPPTSTRSARAAYYKNDVYDSDVDGASFGARMCKGGYEVEFVIPWTKIPGEPPAGLSYGFDLAVDVRDLPASTGRELRSFFKVQPVPTPVAACGGTAEPYCDDRTWCSVKTP